MPGPTTDSASTRCDPRPPARCTCTGRPSAPNRHSRPEPSTSPSKPPMSWPTRCDALALAAAAPGGWWRFDSESCLVTPLRCSYAGPGGRDEHPETQPRNRRLWLDHGFADGVPSRAAFTIVNGTITRTDLPLE